MDSHVFWVTVGDGRQANYQIGIDKRVWGVPEAHKSRIQAVKRGDQILFYGKAFGFALCAVTSDPYEDESPVWPDGDGVYPHRVAISTPLWTAAGKSISDIFDCLLDRDGAAYSSPQAGGRAIGGAGGVFRELTAGELKCLMGRLGPGPKTPGPSTTSDLRTLLEEILERYPAARTTRYSGTHRVNQVFNELQRQIAEVPTVKGRLTLHVERSTGKGNWAEVPWVAFLDERETSTTREGVYPVFLFRGDSSGVYLTFNQGVTELIGEMPRSQAREVLRSRAVQLRDHCDGLTSRGFDLGDGIDLRSNTTLGRDYEFSTAAHKLYRTGAIPGTDEITADIEALLLAYDSYLGSKREPSKKRRKVVSILDLKAICEDFGRKLDESGISFGTRHDDVVASFVASMAAKPFVILTGLSGSGKTQIAIKFGEWLGEGRSRIIAVRPDWTGSEALFGYEDALQPIDEEGRPAWHAPSALRFMLKAARDPGSPYLLVLDEMNLAHVERYFADVLSGMESRKPCLPNVRADSDGQWRPLDGPNEIAFPANLMVVGTVNVDETTYMFSPKVLDRANTLEFRVGTEDLTKDLKPPSECDPGAEELVAGFHEFLTGASTSDGGEDYEDAFFEQLVVLHQVLARGGLEFGHRVVHEALRFRKLWAATDHDLNSALDRVLMQKVLPRLHGARRQLEHPLAAVSRFCFALEANIEADYSSSQDRFDPLKPGEGEPALPGSFDKCRRMTEHLRKNQFASFTD